MEGQLGALGRRIDRLYETLSDVSHRVAELHPGGSGRGAAQVLRRETDLLLRELTYSCSVVRDASAETERAVSEYADSVEARLRLLWHEVGVADRNRRKETRNDEAAG